MLQFITHTNNKYNIIEGAESVLQGGCKWIQLRMKNTDTQSIIKTGKELRLLCNRYNATLIVDDYVEIVKEINAEGVHLGKYDMSPSEARKILGDTAIIGGTANTFSDVKRLCEQKVDYIGLGPFRFTTTKQNLSPILGLDGYKQIVDLCKDNKINIPIVAIGGITLEDVSNIMSTGVGGIAVSGSILNSENPTLETQKFIHAIDL